jgi:MarR family transcriptional regulator, transcriptional regulator for hemolysin
MKKTDATYLRVQDAHLLEISYLVEHENNIFALSSILSNQVARKFTTHLQTHLNLRLADWRVIGSLIRYPNFTAVEITSHWGMDKMIINRSIKRLVKDGYLLRERDKADRRSYRLKPTPKGIEMFTQAAPRTITLYSSYMDVLSKEEQASLLKSMQKIIGHLAEMPDRS